MTECWQLVLFRHLQRLSFWNFCFKSWCPVNMCLQRNMQVHCVGNTRTCAWTLPLPHRRNNKPNWIEIIALLWSLMKFCAFHLPWNFARFCSRAKYVAGSIDYYPVVVLFSIRLEISFFFYLLTIVKKLPSMHDMFPVSPKYPVPWQPAPAINTRRNYFNRAWDGNLCEWGLLDILDLII